MQTLKEKIQKLFIHNKRDKHVDSQAVERVGYKEVITPADGDGTNPINSSLEDVSSVQESEDIYFRSTEEALKAFVQSALMKVGVKEKDAKTVASVLVEADMQGIESHGVARLVPYYIKKIQEGQINPNPKTKILNNTSTSLVIDADNGLGHPVSKQAMDMIIEKARKHGMATAVVRNSNHFGIARYYAMMAAEKDMIGFCTTNSNHFAVPTHGKETMLGTNPMAYAAPTTDVPYVFDCATTAIAKGKLEVCRRKGTPLNLGVATNSEGYVTSDPKAALEGGALLPLGGYGNSNGGHKGYGFGLTSDMLSEVLSGGNYNKNGPGPISHYFHVARIDRFRPVDEFKRDMTAKLDAFRSSEPAPGQDCVYTPGQQSHNRKLQSQTDGVLIHKEVWDDLRKLSREMGIPFGLGLKIPVQSSAAGERGTWTPGGSRPRAVSMPPTTRS